MLTRGEWSVEADNLLTITEIHAYIFNLLNILLTSLTQRREGAWQMLTNSEKGGYEGLPSLKLYQKRGRGIQITPIWLP